MLEYIQKLFKVTRELRFECHTLFGSWMSERQSLCVKRLSGKKLSVSFFKLTPASSVYRVTKKGVT